MAGFGGRCTGGGDDGFGLGRIGGNGGWVHERDGGVAKLHLSGDDFDGAAEDVDGGGHVAVW